MTLRLSTTLPKPMPETPVELYLAPPSTTSRPLSMHPHIMADTTGCGMTLRPTVSYTLLMATYQLTQYLSSPSYAARISSMLSISYRRFSLGPNLVSKSTKGPGPVR